MAGDLSTDAPVYKVPCPLWFGEACDRQSLDARGTGPGEEVSTRTSLASLAGALGEGKCVLQRVFAWLAGGLHGLYWWPESVASSSMKLEGLPRTMAEPEADVSLRGQLYPYYAPNQLINRCHTCACQRLCRRAASP